jgi:hypothetical protein
MNEAVQRPLTRSAREDEVATGTWKIPRPGIWVDGFQQPPICRGNLARRPPVWSVGSVTARLNLVKVHHSCTPASLTAEAGTVTTRPLQAPAVSWAASEINVEFRSRPTMGSLRRSSNNVNFSNRLNAGHQAYPSALRQEAPCPRGTESGEISISGCWC